MKRLFEFLKEGESLHETNAAYSETLEPFEKFYHLYGYVCVLLIALLLFQLIFIVTTLCILIC